MLRELTALFFPDLCAACQQPLVRGEQTICTSCLAALPYTDYHIYPENPVEKLFWGRANLRKGMALFHFNKGNRVQNLMHELKYHGNSQVGLVIGRLLAAKLNESGRFSEITHVIPVPLHKKKQKMRGFNQSELIARGIGEVNGWKVDTESLVRIVNNPTQTRKSRFDRYKNVSGVFALENAERFYGAHVLLVDDVVTTGSTLESCIKTFENLKEISVSLAVAAYAE